MGHAPVSTEVQTITITGTPTGGTFTLEFDGQTTGTIAYNASAATVDTALEALSNIAASEVTCAGGALPGTPVTVTFANGLSRENVAELVPDDSGLTGGTTPTVTVTTTTAGYGAERDALNAGIDTLGALFDTHAAAFSTVELEACYEHLYKLGDMVASALKDQIT